MLDSHQEIHATLDRLAERIGRPAALVDAGYVLVGHSANSLGVDPVRTASVFNRRAPQAAIDWLKSFGIETAEDPVRIPAQPKLHMLSRVIVPIRRRSVLLGFITTQDEPARLTPEELDELRRCAAAFAELMNLMTVERESEAGHDNDTVDLVLRGADEDLQAGVTRLRDRGFDLARPMHVIHALVSDEAVETAGGVRSLREVVAATARRDTTLVAVLEPRQPEITLVTNESTTELELILGSITRLFPCDRVGVSARTETVLGLANAYRQALAAAYFKF